MAKFIHIDHLTPDMLAKCEHILNYQFRDTSLLELALTHSSIRVKNNTCNERLEFLGDAILNLVISEFLYTTFSNFSEGELSTIRSEVVSRKVVAEIAKKLGIHQYLKCSECIQSQQEILSITMLSNIFEAIIGAIYLDSGLKKCQEFILHHFENKIKNIALNPYQKNYKSLLQVISQKYFRITPSYHTIEIENIQQSCLVRSFQTCVVIGKRKYPFAQGKTKKEAQQMAAQKALEILADEDVNIKNQLNKKVS